MGAMHDGNSTAPHHAVLEYLLREAPMEMERLASIGLLAEAGAGTSSPLTRDPSYGAWLRDTFEMFNRQPTNAPARA